MRRDEPPAWLRFLPLGYPSANLIATGGRPQVLFDAGYGSDHERTNNALAEAGISASGLDLIVNTHWHSDHVGGNARLQTEHGIPIASAAPDADLVNTADPRACLAEWLDQPVEQYHVDRPLHPGERLAAGPCEWLVLATPGHTPNHLSFPQPDEQLLVLGDALHADDVGWINLPLDGPEVVDTALHTVEMLGQLPVRLALPGHGPAITDLPRALAAAHARYQRMRADPQRAGWHACKRIFAFALMINDGINLDGLHTYLTSRAWLVDHARAVFRTTPHALAADLLAEMRRTGAVTEHDGKLICRTPYHRPEPDWLRHPGYPRHWAISEGATHARHADQ